MESKKLMKKKLTNLASGELVAVLVFWMNFFLLKKWILTTGAFVSISLSLFYIKFYPDTRFSLLVDFTQKNL